MHAPLDYFAYLQLLTSYSTLLFLAGISLVPGTFLRFGGENDPKMSGCWKTLAKRALSYGKPRLLSYRAWKSVHGYGLYAWLKK